MKKFILGIVGVFILQTAFVALTTSDKAHEAAVKDLASTSGSDPLFGLIADQETTPDLSTPIFADEIAAIEAPATRASRSRPMTATRHFRETVGPSNAVEASTSFDPIIILYEAGAAREKPRAEIQSLVAKEKPLTESRSLSVPPTVVVLPRS